MSCLTCPASRRILRRRYGGNAQYGPRILDGASNVDVNRGLGNSERCEGDMASVSDEWSDAERLDG